MTAAEIAALEKLYDDAETENTDAEIALADAVYTALPRLLAMAKDNVRLRAAHAKAQARCEALEKLLNEAVSEMEEADHGFAVVEKIKVALAAVEG